MHNFSSKPDNAAAESVDWQAAEDEAMRRVNWWDTYNAALQGMYAHRSDRKDPQHHEIHLDARIAADIAHGALEKAT